jgi:hypothetical protein
MIAGADGKFMQSNIDTSFVMLCFAKLQKPHLWRTKGGTKQPVSVRQKKKEQKKQGHILWIAGRSWTIRKVSNESRHCSCAG